MTGPNDTTADFSDINSFERLGSLIIVSGASGTGKSTICKAVVAANQNIKFSVSRTTREPRKGEIDGKDYFFVSAAKFEEMIRAEEFMEYAKVHGNYYGTLKADAINSLNAGNDILLDIDVQGAMIIKEKFKDDPLVSKCAEFIFILPPSIAELEKRLRGRNTDTEEIIQKRLNAARKEISHFPLYDYCVVNTEIEKAVSDTRTIIDSFRHKTRRLR